MEAVQPTSVRLGGTLLKQSDWLGVYRPRFTQVLASGELVFYSSSEDETPRGRMSLADASVVDAADEECIFSVNFSDGKMIRLRAASVDEKVRWMGAIGAQCNRAEPTSSPAAEDANNAVAASPLVALSSEGRESRPAPSTSFRAATSRARA